MDLDCPRCGYPVGAVLTAEAESWPLESRCAECGCGFAWRDLFGGIATAPRTLLEHAPWRRLWRALPTTLLFSMLARPQWRRLRMEHPIRWMRLLIGAPLLIVLLALAQLSMTLADAVGIALQMSPRIQVMALYPSPDGTELVPRRVQHEPIGLPAILRSVLPVIVQPTSERSLLLPVTAVMPPPDWLAKARAAASTMEPLPPLVERPVETARSMGVSPSELWSRRGTVIPAPARLAGLAALVSVLSFVFLPIARRRAKVRFVHLLRASAYLMLGGIPVVALLFAINTAFTVPWTTAAGQVFRAEGNDLPVLLVSILYLAWWWRSAAGDYLRMARPWAVGVSVATLAVLVAMIVDLAWGITR